MTFDIGEFLSPLDLWVFLMAATLGIVMGFRLRQIGPRLTNTRTFWQIADGAVFFIPLALLRAFEGSAVWERLLATLPLWIVYIAAMRLGNSFEWDRLPGNRDRHDPKRKGGETPKRRRGEVDHPLLSRPRHALAPVGQPHPYTGPRRRADDH